MPTLEWIGKEKVINHHQQVPYRVLEEKYTYNAEKSDNMIIRGDNLEALKACHDDQRQDPDDRDKRRPSG